MDNGRPVVAITRQHKVLAEFQVGEWYAVQRVFTGPDSTPTERSGKATYRLLLDGRAGLLETELENPDGSLYRSFTVGTWNVNKARFDGVFMDVHSFDGFDPMNGSIIKTLGSDRSLNGDIPAKRMWDGSITMPRMGPSFSGEGQQLVGVDRIPVQLIENKMNENEWVLLAMMLDAKGDEFVGMEWTFTR